MKLYLNAGFGEPLGAAGLQLIESLGFAGVRQDVPEWIEPAGIEAVVMEFATTPLEPLFLVPRPSPRYHAVVELLAHAVSGLGRGSIELVAEAEDRVGPGEFARLLREGYDIIKGITPGTRIVAGGVATTSRPRLDWLARSRDAGWPEGDLTVGYHTYRTTQEPDKAVIGFSSRAAEFGRLRTIVEARPLWNTEVGWHTAKSKVPAGPFGLFSRTVQFDDAQVADFLEREALINRDAGAEVMSIFQFNDGPGDHYEAHFGIRRLDRSLKPIAERVAAIAERVR